MTAILLLLRYQQFPLTALLSLPYDGDRLMHERFAHLFGPDAGQIVSKTDTM